jgi:hypothetical protein
VYFEGKVVDHLVVNFAQQDQIFVLVDLDIGEPLATWAARRLGNYVGPVANNGLSVLGGCVQNEHAPAYGAGAMCSSP